jgi:hypothetical protein
MKVINSYHIQNNGYNTTYKQYRNNLRQKQNKMKILAVHNQCDNTPKIITQLLNKMLSWMITELAENHSDSPVKESHAPHIKYFCT